MKKIGFLVTLLLSAYLFSVFAVAPAAPSYAANKYAEGNVILQKSAGFDTLVGVDSTVLMTKKPVGSGSIYVITRGPATGTGSDSVAIGLVVDVYDVNSVFVRRVAVDSLTTSAGEDIAIPFFDTIFGEYFTVKLVSYTGNGGQVILPSFKMYTRKLFVEWKQLIK